MDRGQRSVPTAAGWFFARRGTAVASRALAQPKSDLSDFGRLKVPNSGKPEFGAGEGTMVCLRTRMGEGQYPSPIIARGNIEPPSPAAEVGFIRLRPNLKVPELGQARVRVGEGAIMPTAFGALFTFQTAHLIPAARFLRPGLAPLLRSPESRGGRSAERRSGACEAPVGHAVTRRTRRLRGALRPMTRDARLSALHRGGFGLPGPRFRLLRRPPPCNGGHLPSRSVQRAPRSQVVVPGGRGPGPPGASGYEPPAAGRHASLRLQDRLRRRPS